MYFFTETPSVPSSETDSLMSALAKTVGPPPVTDLDNSRESDLTESEKLKKDCAMYKNRVKALEMELMR